MANEITNYLKFANIQMAAEALFDQKDEAPGTVFKGAILPRILTTGNERSSKFTGTQADEFSKDWTVVEHKSNTTTGFSGTLFKCLRDDATRGLVKDQLVMSFRSTEFADDSARDNQATNTLEVKAFGWAFGQIADMERWYADLKTSGKIGSEDRFSVTGYSLGGHLATAFTQMRAEESFNNGTSSPVNATYTFNGAGVGKLFAPSLTQVIESFRQRRQEGTNADLFTNASVRAKYRMSHENRSNEITINSIAACARKQGVGGLFSDEKWAFKQFKILKTNSSRLQNTKAGRLTHSRATHHA